MIDFKIWEHQQRAIDMARNRNTFALFFDVGAGKSLTVLQCVREKYKEHGFIFKTLILAPPIVLTNWVNEIDKFSKIPLEQVEIIKGTGVKRTERIKNSPARIFITNYETLQMDDALNALIEWGPLCIIFDESHRLKNLQAKRTKAAIKLADTAKFKYLLSGSPILNSVLDLFAQYRIMDGGETFGKNFFVFRARYFKDANEKARLRNPRVFPNWVPRDHTTGAVKDLIAKSSLHVKKQECMDLPDFINMQITVEMSAEMKATYKALEKDWIASFDDIDAVAVGDLAITKALRLQQVVTGFVTLDDGTIKKFLDNPRARALRELLEDIVVEGGNKVIIWAVFKENYEQIKRVLKDLGLDYGEIHGDVSDKDKKEHVRRFQEDDNCKVIFGHPASGGIGINLVASNTTIFYSRTFSLEHSIQAEARNYRGGSEIHSKVTRIDLVCPNTIDEDVTQSLLEKKNISKGILKGFITKRKG